MTDDAFYSDRVGQGKPRGSEEISAAAWRGIVALIRRRIGDGSLARAFPGYNCSDDPTGYSTITGVDEVTFLDSLTAHVPELEICAAQHVEDEYSFVVDGPSGNPQARISNILNPRWTPDTITVLDVVEFIALHIDEPVRRKNHEWNGDHFHYFFGGRVDGRRPGQEKFQKEIDLLFARSGIAFTLGDDLKVRRLGPPEARQLISDFRPSTEDDDLNVKLADASARFLSKRSEDRRDAVEKLWDSFERLKTLELGSGKYKKASAGQLLDRSASGSEFYRDVLESEFTALTNIGNSFGIRHHEHGQADLPSDAAVDYLFLRLASLIAYVLRATDRMAS